MKIKDILDETYIALSANKVRSGLTILGIVIGISSVIIMMAIGAGAQGSIESSIKSIGSNLIIVRPGAQRGTGVQVSSGRGSAKTLTNEDALAIEAEVSQITGVTTEVTTRAQVTARGKNTNTSILGTKPNYLEVRNLEIDLGVFISDQNLKNLAKVVVLGPSVRDDLFDAGSDPVGQTIKIKGIQFKVIGLTKSKGGSSFGNQDDVIFMPVTTAQKFLVGDNFVSTINIAALSSDTMTDVQQQISDLLLVRHKIDDPLEADFNIQNQADIVATASSITQTFTILLSALASISLLVGGIGIMNMMLATVTERTREIGLRKAIGARRRDISLQFLVEAIVLTFLGGLIGVLFGFLVSYSVSWLGILEAQVSLSAVLLAFSVSAVIGIIFGYYPARRAAALNPIEALRYE